MSERRRCENPDCRVPLDTTHGGRRFCAPCARARHVARNNARRRKTRPPGEAAFITAGSAFARARADATLGAGKATRRCPTCYTRYRLDRLEAPCPKCADHLVDVPVPLDEGKTG